MFTSDVMVLPLGCCDLVLGVQWLSTLGPIIWDFTKSQMEFSIEGRRFVLRGAKQTSIKLINNKSSSHAVQQGAQLCFLYLNKTENSIAVPCCTLMSMEDHSLGLPATIEDLIQEFQDIFNEPSRLPPRRMGFDHRIPLKEGSIPFNMRPYRYSIIQKYVVDKLVEEMLNQGIIQRSNSPYASPIVLVKKKDGSWRLCVDYRRLDKQTVKDSFPIPLIEDLLDELGGLLCTLNWTSVQVIIHSDWLRVRSIGPLSRHMQVTLST